MKYEWSFSFRVCLQRPSISTIVEKCHSIKHVYERIAIIKHRWKTCHFQNRNGTSFVVKQCWHKLCYYFNDFVTISMNLLLSKRVSVEFQIKKLLWNEMMSSHWNWQHDAPIIRLDLILIIERNAHKTMSMFSRFWSWQHLASIMQLGLIFDDRKKRPYDHVYVYNHVSCLMTRCIVFVRHRSNY